MSGIYDKGSCTAAAAQQRYDTPRYECFYFCDCIETDTYEYPINPEQTVHVELETDGFGPGEVRALCTKCYDEDRVDIWECDWCRKKDSSVSGYASWDSPSEHVMVCDSCRFKDQNDS